MTHNIDRVIQEWETDIEDYPLPCEEIGSLEDYLEEEDTSDGSND